ncbi:MAG TPA: NAD(+) diphosphatase [Methanosphaera sp.]|nr:NAD(+) diphosphatase [Methanosphaera sp.]HIJ15489.1 NAD(+) diphosphatase [Methanosphaera sp.]
MMEKYLYSDYSIGFKEDYVNDDDSYYLIFNDKRELFLTEDNDIPLVDTSYLSNFKVNFNLYIGTYKNHDCFVVNVDGEGNFCQLYKVYEMNKDAYQIATRGVLINDWYMLNQYCGKCGTKTQVKPNSMAFICPNCKTTFHGKIQPAVIIAIHKDDKLLMARHTYDTRVRYALIAGFVEMGESIEEAVKREVKEEVGINIKNIQYMGSQPWPFPNSLMCAFKAEYDSGDIQVDGDEISMAKWFSKDEIEDIESDISIYSKLIEDFMENV